MSTRRAVCVVAALALLAAGCTTFDTIESGLDRMVGQNVAAATDRLGAPDQVYDRVDKKIYIWRRESSSTVLIPQDTFPASRFVSRTINHSCMIEVTTDRNDVVESFGVDGNQSGCQAYASQLAD